VLSLACNRQAWPTCTLLKSGSSPGGNAEGLDGPPDRHPPSARVLVMLLLLLLLRRKAACASSRRLLPAAEGIIRMCRHAGGNHDGVYQHPQFAGVLVMLLPAALWSACTVVFVHRQRSRFSGLSNSDPKRPARACKHSHQAMEVEDVSIHGGS
jgi:hypothetical protein